MSGPFQPSRTFPLRSRHHSPRLPTTAEEPVVCALEDYSYLVGESIAMRSLRAQLRRISPHFRAALITGEEGTGKEVVALALHRLTAESDATFYSHSAASLLAIFPELVARAEGSSSVLPIAERPPGTVFLPEAGDLTVAEQVYLCNAMRRLAGPRISQSLPRAQLPRLIFATGLDLRSLSVAGHFDRNLYRAVSAIEIILPPLRARREDIPLITCGMLSRSAQAGATGGETAATLDGHALSQLQSHDWPGNVRELEYVVDLARQEAGDSVIEAIHLPPLEEFARTHQLTSSGNQPDSHIDRLDGVIQRHVLDVLVRCAGNKVRAAERLGISRSTLYRMLDAGAQQRAS